jgi:hypothetical protein
MDINSKQEFIEFLQNYPEKGNPYPKAEFYKDYVSVTL